VAPAPADLDDRRVEITGPVERKMMINAFNSGAKVFMGDFEDALSPTWENVIAGQGNCQDAVRRTMTFTAPDGREYRLAERIATLVVRPRGWHLSEKHVLLDGAPVSASLFDFGLYFFHNAAELLRRGSGPYFYLPKLEGHLEARLWNDVFVHAQDALGIPRGTIRATVLIETAPSLAAAAAPRLDIAGESFTVDGRARFLLLVSYFDALRASDATLDADFGFLRRRGLDGVRIFPNWWRCAAERQCGGRPGGDTLFEAGSGHVRPARLARLRQVLDLAGRHGLVVDLSFARETVRESGTAPPLSPTAYGDALASVLRSLGDGYPHVMIDLQNELDQNRLFAADAAEDARQVAALARRIATPRRIVFASTNESEAELVTYCGRPGLCPASARPLDVLAVHDARVGQWHDRTPAVVRIPLRLLGRLRLQRVEAGLRDL